MTVNKDEIRKALEEATPRPWVKVQFQGWKRWEVWQGSDKSEVEIARVSTTVDETDANALLIANSPEWLSALLDENTALLECVQDFINRCPCVDGVATTLSMQAACPRCNKFRTLLAELDRKDTQPKRRKCSCENGFIEHTVNVDGEYQEAPITCPDCEGRSYVEDTQPKGTYYCDNCGDVGEKDVTQNDSPPIYCGYCGHAKWTFEPVEDTQGEGGHERN